MKQKLLNLFVLCCFVLCVAACGKVAEVTEYSIIPEPVQLTVDEGTAVVCAPLKISLSGINQDSPTAKYVSQSLSKMHMRPSFVSEGEKCCLSFVLNKDTNEEIGNEGYVLEANCNGIVISANTEAGLFYGFQTFVQMMPDDVATVSYSKVTVPACKIVDYPRYEWRGSHMDVCRHFFPMSQIKKHLDVMAAYKMNRFHWHLTEDQGWRLEIEKYPLLTEVGAWRVDRNDEDWNYPRPVEPGEKATYGGFYSKKDVAEIIEYAAQRHIEVVPEIEFPGHCCAVLAAYPELSCRRDTVYGVAVADYWPPTAIMCAGNDSVQTFLKDVFDEVIEMFPFQYIHVGGDEAFNHDWEQCPKCQARIKELGFKSELDSPAEAKLQSWLTAEIEKYLISKGKRIIGWDEILEGFVTPSCTVMSWRGTKGGIEAAKKGNDVIMTPTKYCYFDYRQSDSLYQPQAIGRASTVLPISRVYQFNPSEGLSAVEATHVLGGQCNLWAEFIKTCEHQEYLLLPRLCAMSECLWSPMERKSWERFQGKVEHHKDRLTNMGYNVCWGSFKPIMTIDTLGETYTVTMEGEEIGTEFHYTIDGSEPTEASPVYAEPLIMQKNSTLKTIATYRNKVREGVYTFEF
ncbi:MAG: family 20 glycosylhydrolase [Bacteroidales bacterium]|nr:family 20 glycosylhydrolase [Bacteroidales bacterium]